MAYNGEVGGYKEDTTGQSPERQVEQTIARRRASQEWLRANYWDEFTEAWQAYKCRTNPIYKKRRDGSFETDEKGARVEDTTRTNVAMPDFFIAIRKKASRKSRRPPTIRIRAKDPDIAAWLTHWTAVQWDRSNEQRLQRRHVLQGDIFGISLKCHYWNTISASRTFRYRVEEILEKLYVKYDEQTKLYAIATEAEKGYLPAKELDGESLANLQTQLGEEVGLPQSLSRFEGPVSSLPFIGDWAPEPGLEDIHTAAWHAFDSIWDAEKLAVMAAATYTDPETGEERPALDKKAVAELADCDPYQLPKELGGEAREQLRQAIFKSAPSYETRLVPGARYHIITEYTFRRGVCWLRYIGNEKINLGEHPLPFDLDGRYPLSAYTPIEDLLTAIGDSTPRMGRYLWRLHNVNVAQRVDITTNLMKPTLVVRKGLDLPPEIMDTGLMRLIFADNPRDFGRNLFEGIRVPAEAFQMAAEVVRLIQQLEPQLIDFGEQSQAMPDSRKVATLGLLQQRAQEALSSDELEALNQSIADETEIKILMLQQMMTDKLDLAPGWRRDAAIWSIQGGGGSEHPRKTLATPYELQVDFEVEPEMASTLALDDEYRRAQAKDLVQLATAMPGIINVRKALEVLLATYSGVKPSEFILPEPPPAPKGPETRFNISLSIKWESLSPKLQAVLAQKLGIEPGQDVSMEQMFHLITKAGEAAQASQEMFAEQPETEGVEK